MYLMKTTNNNAISDFSFPGNVSDAEWRSYICYLEKIKVDYEKFKIYSLKCPDFWGEFLQNMSTKILKNVNK